MEMESNVCNFPNILVNIREKKEKLDSSSTVKARVKYYQRPFSWSGDQIEELIADWSGISIEPTSDNGKYFCGAIVTAVTTKESFNQSCSKIEEHSLVDGQQRFTVLYLTNFLRSQILRLCAREAIHSQDIMEIEKILNEYIDCARWLFSSNIVEGMKEKLIDLCKDIAENNKRDEENRERKEKEYPSLIKRVCTLCDLPSINESDEGYDEEYKTKLFAFLEMDELLLSYDRTSYNKSLLNSMSDIKFTMSSQNEISWKGEYSELEDQNESTDIKYKFTIKKLFDWFCAECFKSADESPYEHAKRLAVVINRFLNEVEVCVVQTNNENDSYVLFEVLNARGIDVPDIQLVKNNLLKKFCDTQIELDDTGIDTVISELDSLSEETFGDIDAQLHKYICQYGLTCIICEKDNSKSECKKPSRDELITKIYEKSNSAKNPLRSISAAYLKNYTDIYSAENVKSDFEALYFASQILKVFGLKARNRWREVIEAETESNVKPSSLLKTVRFIWAAKYDAVFGAFIATIYRFYKNSDESKSDLNVQEKIERYLKRIIVNDPNTTDRDYILLQKYSKVIWQGCVFGFVIHKKPFEMAKKLTDETVSISPSQNLYSKIQTILSGNIFDEDNSRFKKYWNEWRYTKSSEHRNLAMLLMIRLIRLSEDIVKSNDSATDTDYQAEYLSMKNKLPTLDHLEPKEMGEPNDKYFQHDEREDIIHQLGNMFCFSQKNNSRKSNRYFSLGVPVALQKSKLEDNWLSKKMLKIYDNNRNDAEVPTINFFNKWREQLIEYYYKLVKEYNTKDYP